MKLFVSHVQHQVLDDKACKVNLTYLNFTQESNLKKNIIDKTMEASMFRHCENNKRFFKSIWSLRGLNLAM